MTRAKANKMLLDMLERPKSGHRHDRFLVGSGPGVADWHWHYIISMALATAFLFALALVWNIPGLPPLVIQLFKICMVLDARS